MLASIKIKSWNQNEKIHSIITGWKRQVPTINEKITIYTLLIKISEWPIDESNTHFITKIKRNKTKISFKIKLNHDPTILNTVTLKSHQKNKLLERGLEKIITGRKEQKGNPCTFFRPWGTGNWSVKLWNTKKTVHGWLTQRINHFYEESNKEKWIPCP